MKPGWSVTSLEQVGNPAKVEAIVSIVDGKRASLQNGESEWEGGLYLVPASNPKTFDPGMSEKTVEGIYSLDGDTPRLCYDPSYGAKRPAGFTTEKDSQFLLVLKRTVPGPEIFLLGDGTRSFPKLIELTTPPPKVAPPVRSMSFPLRRRINGRSNIALREFRAHNRHPRTELPTSHSAGPG